MDLGQVDWKAVQDMFATGRQRTAAQKLRSMLSARITRLTLLNPTRVDLIERFQRPLDDYNAGSLNVQTYFEQLVYPPALHAVGRDLGSAGCRRSPARRTERIVLRACR